MPGEERNHSVVIFSAHSLPEKILQAGDPYPDQLAMTAKLIAEKAGLFTEDDVANWITQSRREEATE